MIKPIGHVMRWWRHAEVSAPLPLPRAEIPLPADPQPWKKTMARLGLRQTLTYPSLPLGKVLDQAAGRFGDSAGLIYHHRTWTWREIQSQANRFAGGLASHGIRPGDRVLMTLPNCPEWIFTFFAIQKLGAIAINAGPLLGPDDLASILDKARPAAVVGIDLQAPLLMRSAGQTPVSKWIWVSLQGYQTVLKRLGYQLKLWHKHAMHPQGEHLSFSQVMEDGPSRPPTIAPDMDDTALLQPTGGTTGTLKMAELTHRNLLSNATQAGAFMRASMGQETILAILPFFHSYGLTVCLTLGTLQAGRIIPTTRFDPQTTVDLIEEHKPTIFPIVPAICEAICDQLERTGQKVDWSQMACISGAAPLASAVAHRFENLTHAKIVEGYGLTEASPVTHCNPLSEPRRGPIGLPFADTQSRIVDLENPAHILASGEAGELLVSGPQIMKGYYQEPAQNQQVFYTDESGVRWLRTGDVAKFDDEGFFYILDRKKDMIIRNGEKIYPSRVERVLKAHPGVADVAVIGRPDPAHGESAVALVVRRGDEPDEQLAAGLRALCTEHLSPMEIPAQFEFVPRIPRTALGKAMKNQIRQQQQKETS